MRSQSLHKPAVGVIAPTQEAVPGTSGNDPLKYAGTERVVSYLVQGLHESGINVSLFAAGNSSAEIKECCDFYPTVPTSLRQTPPFDKDPTAREAAAYLAAVEALAQAQDLRLDIIHNHIGTSALLATALQSYQIPMVTTLHGNMEMPLDYSVYTHRVNRGAPLISISNSQRRPVPHLNFVSTVYNPIPTHNLQPRYSTEERVVWPGTIDMKHGEYLAWLGRFSPEKRPHIAIDAAAMLGMPIVLAGKREAHEKGYWDVEIAPRLEKHHSLVTVLGEVNDREKNLLLRGAAAFLMPINWEEPFGLVVGEALACGTPVVATRMGSMPELITHGEVGFLVDPHVDEHVFARSFAETMQKYPILDRRACRNHVKEHFSIDKHVEGTIRAYWQVIGRRKHYSFSSSLTSFAQ